jgi:hypothetical protein
MSPMDPKYSEKQLSTIPKKFRKLRKKTRVGKKSIVMDFEMYFTFTNGNIENGNDGYYTSDRENVPDNVKYLYWIAIKYLIK